MERFLERDHDVRFHIGPTLCGCTAPAKPAESRTAAPAPKKSLEEIAESSSAKLKFHTSAIAAPLIKSAAGLLSLPLRWRLETAGPVPIRAELIVFLSLFRITQNLICFVDLLKLFFGGLFV